MTRHYQAAMSAILLQSRQTVTIFSSLAILAFLCLGYYQLGLPLSRGESISNYATPAFAEQEYDLLDDAANATLGFQKIFIINLATRTDRKDAATLAAKFTGLEVEFIEGATHVDPKALPPGGEKVDSSSAAAWRSHMNVVRRIIEDNITSALVLEDDADWDIRIKSQMRDFAKASRLLIQPLPNTTDQFLDPTWPKPDAQHQLPTDFDINTAFTREPKISPYGDLDRWGIFWLGHCGCRFPFADDLNVPIGRAVIPNDETAPPMTQYNKEFGDEQYLSQYPDFTRVVARSRVNTCTLAYGISQAAARQILYELGVRRADSPLDMMYRSLCHGSDGRPLMVCLSPQPALFNHHRPAGPRSSWSDINSANAEDSGWEDVPKSENIRWAARVNIPRFVSGRTDWIDSYTNG